MKIPILDFINVWNINHNNSNLKETELLFGQVKHIPSPANLPYLPYPLEEQLSLDKTSTLHNYCRYKYSRNFSSLVKFTQNIELSKHV